MAIQRDAIAVPIASQGGGNICVVVLSWWGSCEMKVVVAQVASMAICRASSRVRNRPIFFRANGSGDMS
eukprot:scaffold38088_cov35-Attheya_sp.AAC.4